MADFCTDLQAALFLSQFLQSLFNTSCIILLLMGRGWIFTRTRRLDGRGTGLFHERTFNYSRMDRHVDELQHTMHWTESGPGYSIIALIHRLAG